MKYLGCTFDFSNPPGATALTPAGGVSWRVFSNPVTLAIGGITAVILELGEPRVRAGVWNHSIFKDKPLTRMIRTGKAAQIAVYAPKADALDMIARVSRMHERVSGTLSDGTPYAATDPALLDWVQATASFGFVTAYDAYCRALTPSERDAGYAESAAGAAAFGATGSPLDFASWQHLYDATLPRLAPSAVLNDFLALTRKALPVPNAIADLYVNAAVAALPEGLAQQLALTDHKLTPRGRAMVTKMARLANRVAPGTPCAQSMKRVGLRNLPKGGGDFELTAPTL